MGTGVEATHRTSRAMCDGCLTTWAFPTNGVTRADMKVAVHDHVRDTGHHVRFVDGATLIPSSESVRPTPTGA